MSDDPIPFDESEWIAANDALAQLVTTFGSRPAAKAAIADGLRDGEIRAWAKYIWVAEGQSLNAAWKSRQEAELQEKDLAVPVNYWRSRKRWTLDQSDWRWPYNKFSVTLRLKPRKRRMIKGMSLFRADINKLVNVLPDPIKTGKEAAKSGNPGKMHSRDAFWNAIVKLALEERLNAANFPTQVELVDEINEMTRSAAGEIYREKTMKVLVSQVWRTHILPN